MTAASQGSTVPAVAKVLSVVAILTLAATCGSVGRATTTAGVTATRSHALYRGFITSRGPAAMNCGMALNQQSRPHAYVTCGANRPRRPWRNYIKLTMNRSGRLSTCRGCISNSDPVPTLRAGRSIKLGPFRCTSLARGAVRCVVVGTGHGFRMNVRGFRRI